MIKDATVASPTETLVQQPKKVKPENLKQRAYLNSVSSMIDYAGVQLTGIVVSPFIVGGLGGAMYGVWKMLGQMTGYAGLADTRSTQVLKWTVAKKKDIADDSELRSDFSSAFIVTLLVMPLVLIVGSVVSWYAPYITKTPAAYFNLVRITCSVLILSLAISKISELYDAVLRGMNLGFKRMGFRATIVICGGALKVLALTQGFGLIGLSVVQILITLITGFVFYITVKKNVPWFGFGKTNFRKVMAFTKLSGWNMANTATDTVLTNSDKVLLGIVTGPVLVSSYALTTFLPLAIQGLILKIILGMMPGVGKLLGLQEYSKINKIRSTTNDFIYLVTTACGVAILLFNNSFLHAWVGDGFYAGNWANGLIMLIVIQDVFLKHDGFLITATLDLRKKVFLTCMAAMVFIGSGIVLAYYFGISGLCLSLLLGKFLLFTGQRRFLESNVHQSFRPFSEKIRPLATSALMLGIACYLSSFIQPVGWLLLLVFAPLAFFVSLLLFYLVGMEKHQREVLLETVSSVKFFKLK